MLAGQPPQLFALHPHGKGGGDDPVLTLEIGQTLNFIARMSEGTSVSCIWDFDDGTPPLSGCDVEHTYVIGGNYTVKLWTVNSIGAAVTKTNLKVTDPTPAAQGNALYLPAIRR